MWDNIEQIIMSEKPSDIHSKKEHKLTRRRIMKYLTAAGMTPVAASRITVDDVKAADSDQVPISLDVEGEIKKNVPADWYDQLIKTRDVRDRVGNNHGHRKSVISVGYSGGEGTENPHLVITFNKNSDQKEKDKSETPEERDGIEIKKQEVEPPEPHNCPDSTRYDLICDDYDCRPLPVGDNIPGGTLADITYVGHGWGGITSRTMDNNATYHNSWMITAHQANCAANRENVYHQPAKDGGEGYKIGELAEVHPQYAVAIIEATRGVDDDILPSPYVHESSNIHSGDVYGPIENTMSQDGVDIWRREERLVFRYGPRSCYADGKIQTIDKNYSVDDSLGWCASEIKEVIKMKNMESDSGDSGSLEWGYYSPDDVYLGISMHITSESGGLLSGPTSVGTAGYRINNDLGYYWK